VLLALAPFFILLLMFNAPSRFFVGWVVTTVQMVLAPIFLYVFMAFYLISIKDIVIALKISLNQGGVPAMKDAAPFVLMCFAGLFLLFQIFPLAARLAASVPQLAVTAMRASNVQQRFAAWRTSAKGAAASSPVQPPQANPVAASPSETIIRDLQEQKAALTRLGRNR
jgi:type IV secretion system protein VirB6